jgi:hypothetical protein
MIQINEDEMGEACSTHKKYEIHKKIYSEDIKVRGHLGDRGIGGKILKWILNN